MSIWRCRQVGHRVHHKEVWMTEQEKRIVKAIDRLVQEGKAERCIVDGEPGVRLTEKGARALKEAPQ
jgi:MinD superfamily P-loop ATPase